jgi:hypothetical protein
MSREVGLAQLTLLHVWRIPAGLLFLWYGSAGHLPPAFWIPAGSGDVLVGVMGLFAMVDAGRRASSGASMW